MINARWYYYLAAGVALRNTPMRGHWGALEQRINAAAIQIGLLAQGRRANALHVLAQMTPITHFAGWSIDIRYADTACVPVSQLNHQAWHDDATEYMLKFAL